MSEPTDAQMEGYEFRRAGGAAPTASQWDGQAADEWARRGDDPWANARRAVARARVATPTEFREMARLNRENARLREYLDACYEFAWSEVWLNVGPKTSDETRDDFLDAMTNWAVDTGRQAPELDDTLGSEL